jgi:hypothetical protein
MAIQILGLAILSVMIAWWFEPLQWLKRLLGYQETALFLKYDPFSCSKCVGFWFGLAMTQHIYLAAIISVCAYLIDNLISYIEDYRHG